MSIRAPLNSDSEPADTVKTSIKNRFPIVGVGASAGGLDAFTQLLKSLPKVTGMAYVLIQHLDPHHEACLSDLLSNITCLPIQEATQDLAVCPDHVYVIPPNMSITMCKGLLHLTPREDMAKPFLPIDLFLRSLAVDQKDRAIGLVLSGTGIDGTQGLEAIKAIGGITFAQDQVSAKFWGMPQSAIQTGCVDFILTPQEMGQELIRISNHPYMTPYKVEGQELVTEEQNYKKILALICSTIGIDFSAYRDTTLKRRIMRRMVLHTKKNLLEYMVFLENNTDEIEALYHDLLINVTSFFREPDTFESLKKSVFPELLNNRESASPIRIWVPGCSTGQEVYSLAITLLEFLSDKVVHPNIQIFATDLSEERALQKAREGLYPDSIEAEVTPKRLQRFFTKECDNYRISKSIRDMCVFAKHNVAADPPFSRMDFISCRNMLIYFGLPLQRRVISTFHYALNSSGFLLLGASETIGVCTDLFAVVNQSMRIYSKKIAVIREYPHFSSKDFLGLAKNTPKSPITVTSLDWQREADQIILKKCGPAGVLVNDNLDILQFRGKTSPYLEPASGEPSHNLLRMACQGLFPSLRNTINESRKHNVSVRRKNIRIKKDEQIRKIDIQVLPVRLPDSNESCFLVLFEESRISQKSTVPQDRELQREEEVTQLHQELASMYEYIQSIIEQKNTINEELRSTNEEFLSGNEELQSTNEELQTAKEELQSINEELITINEQLDQRNKELSNLNEQLQESRDYAEAIVKTVREPLIVLDADLRVQTANPAFYKVFKVTSEMTNNRLIYDLGNHQWDIPELRSLLGDILPRKTKLTDFEVCLNLESIGSKIMMLNARTVVRQKDEAPLVLLAIEDISERKQLQNELETSNKKLAETDQRKDEFLAILAHELRNPLAPLIHALAILRLPDVGAEIVLQAYEIIDNQLKQMVRLVDDLLDVSRITSGKIKLRIEPIELGEIVRHAIQTSQSIMDDAKHIVTVTLPEEPLWLDADSARMAQILGNLLNNAAKYTENGGLIQLSVEHKENTVFIRVKDNGIGLSPEILPHIFDMFLQVDSSIERAKGGMGIGLALVKKLVQLHGGSVTAASLGVGHGSEFTVCLTLNSSEHKIMKISSQKNILYFDKEERATRTLVVDDNIDVAKSLGWLLELVFGHQVRIVHDGSSAIATAKSFLPDLVFLDIGLSGMSGYEVCQILRHEPLLQHVIIVAQTGWGQEEDINCSRKAGFDYHLVKPISVEVLQKLLDSLKLRLGKPLN